MRLDMTSLNSIASLIASTPPTNQTSHLLSLLHQRLLALSRLQDNSVNLYNTREGFEDLIATYRARIEDERVTSLRGSKSSTTTEAGGRKTSLEVEVEFLRRYKEVIEGSEREWEKNSDVFKLYQLVYPTSTSSTSSYQSTPTSSQFSTPTPWLDELELNGSDSNPILEFLSLLISDPYTLGAGIVLEESLSPLISSQSSSFSSTSTFISPFLGDESPIKTLLKFLASSSGSESVLQLVLGIWEGGIRELVGREVSDDSSSYDDADDIESTSGKGKGKSRTTGGGRGAREKELEEFLIGVLEVLDSMGLEVDSLAYNSNSTSTSTASTSTGTGPFTLGRNIEDILLSLLHESRNLPRPCSSSSPSLLSPLSTPVVSSTAPSNTPWNNLTTSLTNLGTLSASSMINVANLSTKGIVGVANLGVDIAEIAGKGVVGVVGVAGKGMVGVANVAIPGLFNSSSVVDVGGKVKEGALPIPSSFRNPGKSASIAVPSSPSRMFSTGFTSSTITSTTDISTPRNSLLIQTAISLLQAFTPPSFSTSSNKKQPLLQIFLIRLLSISFPSHPTSSTLAKLKNEERSPLHKKVLVLFLLRYWSFSWLSSKLTHLPSGGSHITPLQSYGIPISSSTSPSLKLGNTNGLKEIGKRGTTALFDEVYLDEKENLDLFMGVHKILYSILVEVCGLNRAEDGIEVVEGSGKGESEREKRRLKKAAQEFVESLGSRRTSTNAAPDTEDKNFKYTRAFTISSAQFVTLVSSFSTLVIPTIVAGPSSPSPSNPQRTSFKRGSSYSSTASASQGKERERSGNRNYNSESETRGGGISLGEQLERALDDLRLVGPASSGRVEALLFSMTAVGEKIDIVGRLPAEDIFITSNPTTTIPSTPPDASTPRSNSVSPSKNLESGWISPPRSPRHEAMREGITNNQPAAERQDYFDLQSTSLPISESPPSLIQSASVSWAGRTKKQEKKVEEASVGEIVLLRKAVVSLIRSGYSGSSATSNPMEEIIRIIISASRDANSERDYSAHVLYSQAASILQHYSTNTSILDRIASPFLETYDLETSKVKLVQSRLGELELQYRRLLDTVRSERGTLDDLRIRMWYESSVRSSSIYQQLINRLLEASRPRSSREQDEARRIYEDWSNELGIFSFVKSVGSTFEQSLQLVEVFIAMTMNPETFYASSFWSREGEIVKSLVSNRVVSKNRPSFAETLLSTSTSILTAPLSLAGLTSTTSNVVLPAPPPNIVLSFGAASPSLLRPHEASINFAGAVEEQLSRIGLKLAGLVWSDVSASIVSNRDPDGRLIGSDGWMENFASPLSPLLRSTPSEFKYGKVNVPKAFAPTTPAPPPYCRDLLRRFQIHPSPQAKMHALFELEVAITAHLSAPTSAFGTSSKSSRNPTTSTNSTPRSMIAKLSGLLAKRMSLAPSPITVLLEGGEDDSEEILDDDRFSHHRNPSILSANEVSQSPHRRRRLSSIASDHSIGSTVENYHPLLLLNNPAQIPVTRSGSSPTTDELLAAFEGILKHIRPTALFQNLQIIASITPSTIDSGPVGKSFWDISLSALSIKKDIVEGEFGIVERGISALSEGTEEGRELAAMLFRTAANEDSQIAIELLKSFVTS